jgi:hypothetical protein
MNKASSTDIMDFLFDLFDLLNFIIEVFRNLGELFNRQ